MGKVDYYGSYASSGKPKNRKLGISLLFDAFFLILSIAVAGLFVCLLLSTFISPEALGAFSAIGLYALYLYMAMTALVLYWIVRWRLINASFMAVLLIVGLFFISPFYKLEISKQHPQKFPRSFKLMSYNLRQMDIEQHRVGYDSLRSFLVRENPNIVVLQEAFVVDSIDTLLMSRRFSRMPYTKKRRDTSMAIYSRYNFAKGHEVDSLPNIIWADIIAGDDTVRIFNISLHLDNAEIDSLTGKPIYHEQNISQRMQSWSENSRQRVEQARSIQPYLKACPYPYVVVGSINDIAFSYAYNLLSDGLQDAYVEKGFGFSYTYRGFEDMQRLDYALVSPKLEVLSYEVLEHVDMAEHYPLFVRFDYESNKKK